MADAHLHRDDAPFSSRIWEALDATVTGAATGQLAARRLLHAEGPFGLGLKAIPAADAPEPETEAGKASVSAAAAVPLALIRSKFVLPVRDIVAFETAGTLLDLRAAARAAIACARQEDDILFYGSRQLGTEGLLSAKGAQSVKLSPWTEVGKAADDVIKAVTRLDEAGYHGPYSLALAPALYNLLLRRYPQGDQTEMDHVRQIVTDGVVKAPAIKEGGVLLAAGRWFASIVLGQDMVTSFIGPAGADYEFLVCESLALRLSEPTAVCVLK